MSRGNTYNDGTARRADKSSGITRHPKYVLARTYEEVQAYARRTRTHIKYLHFIDGPHRIRQELPEGTKFQLIRTGEWFLLDKGKLEEIEFELKMREDWRV